jgi:putative transcriptional regulator
MKTHDTRTKNMTVAQQIISGLEEFADALETGETVSEKFTCRKVMLNLEPRSYDSKDVRRTRKLLGASQALFAQFLGVSAKTVRSWEQGVNTPKDMACRFMDEIQFNPAYYRKRLKQSLTTR